MFGLSFLKKEDKIVLKKIFVFMIKKMWSLVVEACDRQLPNVSSRAAVL